MKLRFFKVLMLFVLPLAIYATVDKDDKKLEKKKAKMEQMLESLSDSSFEDVKREDLLKDEVYIKLARDGWSSQEIMKIMGDYINENRKSLRGSYEYGMYAKQWLPIYGYTPGGDSIYQFVEPELNEQAMANVRRILAQNTDNYYKSEPYTPDARLSGRRSAGIFRPVEQKPYTGRVHWIVVNPADADSLMVIPDGAGIFRTGDMGRTWDCVTDRIPDPEFRKICSHSAIPVDPDNWDHFFAFMKNGGSTAVYETSDGGQSWRRIQGATHKSFKRGYGFKNKAGEFKFIGAIQGGSNYLGSELWISEDFGVTWTKIPIPEDLKETHPETKAKGAFLQNFAFNPLNRDKIYFTASRSIYYFDDGAKATVVNGVKQYNVKKLRFNVYAQDGKTLRAADTTEFPYAATSQGYLEINPNDTLQMWFATASRNVSYGVYSAVYRSDDGGKNWITLQEPKNGYGSGLAFGNESPWGWLGGFGVNFVDTTRLYGCSMSSAKSFDGGRTFREFGWGTRLKSEVNGGFYYITSSRHNADNHCIVSHPSGRVFRGSDSGLLMIDPAINGHEWVSIDGNMGNQLHYSIKVNEFGDQLMLGNTQDVDVQTYREGRWGAWRGYEGSEAFINPYSQTCYFSGSGGGGGLNGVSLSSWYEGYTFPDVFTGNWYLIHNPRDNSKSLFRIEDFGNQTVNISSNTVDDSGSGIGARDLFITRYGDHAVIYALNMNNTLVRSDDGGNTFRTIKVIVKGNVVDAKYSNTQLSGDPMEEDYVYLVQNGPKILKIYTGKTAREPQELNVAGLPQGADCSDFIFHEGSGDMYFFSKNYGLYILENGSSTWKLWMKGYNPLQSGRIALNYTTQEMVLADYGRGVWVADLQNPADRYFKDGFRLKELSNVDGRRTIGIDTKWTIPQYYNYAWFVNDVEQANPYQYLSTKNLNKGDKVKLVLTLRESPDVSTTSEVYVVSDSPEVLNYEKVPGNALYSDGKGRIDLGYVDYFFNDFSLDLWVKPESDGVILANCPVEVSKDTRGWALLVEGGVLKFRYAPANKFSQPTYEAAETQEANIIGPAVEMGKWTHIVVSQDRDGMVSLYVDGNLKNSGLRIKPTHSLNSSMYLSLFADGFENKPIKAAVDELKIWNYPMDEEDVRRAMFSHSTSNQDGLVAYWAFNAGQMDKEHELFSRSGMKPRVSAVTTFGFMPVPVAAVKADLKSFSGKADFADGGSHILSITPNSDANFVVGVYEYSSNIASIPGIDDEYYNVVSVPYQVRTFSQLSGGEKFNIEFSIASGAKKDYQLYMCELLEDSKHWVKLANLSKTSNSTLLASDIDVAGIQNKVLIVLENKAAIEMQVKGGRSSNEFVVYDDNHLEFEVEANLVGGMKQPSGLYQIKSKTGLLGIKNNLTFVGGKASTSLVVNVDSLKGRTVVHDTIIGANDHSLIPFSVVVKNRILSREVGQAVAIQSGGLQMTDRSLYSKLNGSNTVTMMGWVRIDNAAVLSGVRPLIFFRGSGTSPCGIHLADGNLRCHWNDGMYGRATNLTLTSKDLGRWVHVALVARPNVIELYLDGQKAYFSGNVPGAKIGSQLMLGQNYSGDKWFTGAFDQVSLWNRAVSEDEVRYYMMNSPKLNDEGLVAYINMDDVSEDGDIFENVQGSSLVKLGSVSTGIQSNAPYNPKRMFVQNTGNVDKEAAIYLEMPAAKAINCEFSEFEGRSFNYVSQEHPEYSPLINEHYTLVYTLQPKFVASDNLVLVFNKPQIKAGDKVVLALRNMGSENEFDTFVDAQEVGDGFAKFALTGDLINYAKEMMLFTDTNISGDVEVRLLSAGVAKNDTIVLDAVTNDVTIKTQVIRGNMDADVTLVATESAYASIENNKVDMNLSEQVFKVKINKENLNKLGVNPVTIKLSGVTVAEEYKFYVVLEPIVNLELSDADAGNFFLADVPMCSFAVRAKLVQGIMPDGLKISTSAGNAVSSTDIGVGTAVANTDVVIKENLEFYEGDNPLDEGWNLVGNPYLSDVNFTKEQNIVVDESKVLKFLYQYNYDNDTYTVWDMVDNYDPGQRLSSLQPFFIQTTQPGAALVVKPQAKSWDLNRRVLNHMREKDSKIARIALYVGDSEDASDRTEIKVQSDSESDFVFGEDAVKMWGGMNGKSNEIATYNSQRYMSINVFPDTDVEIPVYLRLNSTGNMRLAVNYLSGFDENDKLVLVDSETGVEWDLLDGDGYHFSVNDVNNAAKRFVVRVKSEMPTDIDNNVDDKVKVYADGDVCVVENLDENSLVEIFDVAGRRIVYHRADDSMFSMRLERGNYIVNVREDNKDFTTKINIR